MLDLNTFVFHQITDVVETGIDVLAPVVEHWILAEGDRRLVVHPEAHCLSFLAVEPA